MALARPRVCGPRRWPRHHRVVVRSLTPEEIDDLLALDVPANLATLDADGFPHVTPIWFLWRASEFLMTSLPTRPHVVRLRRDSRAGLNVHVERSEQPSGERFNRQVRVVGHAVVELDEGGEVTRQITLRYLHGMGASAMVKRRTDSPRALIRLRPDPVIAVASY